MTAARALTKYIDQHSNGNRLLVSISGDQITLITHLQSLCDDFSMRTPQFPDLGAKLAHYKPGWWATWNDIDPGTLEDLHTHYSLEQVAEFKAFDDPERNILVLFKLHPSPRGPSKATISNSHCPTTKSTLWSSSEIVGSPRPFLAISILQGVDDFMRDSVDSSPLYLEAFFLFRIRTV